MSLFSKRWDYRKLIAGGIAFLLYTIYTGWILVAYEKYLCDLVTEDVIALRLMSGVPRAVLGCSFCGATEEAIRKRIGGDEQNFLRRVAAGIFALCIFQLPIYIISALIMRVGAEQMLITCGIYIAIDILFGWSYVVLLERMRKWFGVYLKYQS